MLQEIRAHNAVFSQYGNCETKQAGNLFHSIKLHVYNGTLNFLNGGFDILNSGNTSNPSNSF